MKRIIINSKKHGRKIILLDDADFEYINQWRWSLQKSRHTFYAIRGKNETRVIMHKLLLPVDDPKTLVDHKDKNGLNNQRSNLRIATLSQNNINTTKRKNTASKYRGLAWRKRDRHWEVCIRVNRVCKFLGCFKVEEEAALAYNKAATELHGEFANLNTIR